MTVKEMIEFLGQFDPGMECLFECCSDYAEFEDGFVPKVGTAVIWHGKPIRYFAYQWGPGSKNAGHAPEFREYVIFPGN